MILKRGYHGGVRHNCVEFLAITYCAFGIAVYSYFGFCGVDAIRSAVDAGDVAWLFLAVDCQSGDGCIWWRLRVCGVGRCDDILFAGVDFGDSGGAAYGAIVWVAYPIYRTWRPFNYY